MKIYVAGPYSKRAELAIPLAAALVEAGHTVTSRWLFGEESGDQAKYAVQDYDDVAAAEVLVCITGFTQKTGGGRHTELGIALALGKRCYILGPIEQIFHHHPRVIQVLNLDELLALLSVGVAA